MTITQISPQGEEFIIDNESCPERAYKDSGGVVTVGPGLTELDPVFKQFWAQTRGHPLRVGDVLPRAEALKVFRTVLNDRYVPAVVQNIQPQKQHHLDGAADVAWNCGPGATTWHWAQALRQGEVKACVDWLRKTAITVHGTVLQGLINRRTKEANLIDHGDYGNGATVTDTGGMKIPAGISQTPDEIKEYQGQLAKLGYYKGSLDGKAGKGSLTEGAVKNFQRATPGLKVDGRVGPATRAALIRACTGKDQGVQVLGGGAVTGGGLTTFHLDWWWILGGAVALAVVLVLGFYLWNHRGLILRKRTPA